MQKNKHFYSLMLELAIPVMISHLISSSLNLVDNIMIGQLMEANITATGLANQITFVLILIFFGINSGTSIFMAQFWGKKEIDKIQYVIGISFIISASIGLSITLITSIWNYEILSLMTSDTEVISLGSKYLKIISPGFLLQSITMPIIIASRAIGKTKISMYASIVSIISNTILNYLLIFGNFGMPRLEIAGAAIATLTARGIETLLIMFFLFKYMPELKINIHTLRTIPKDLLTNVLKKSLPVLINEGFWALGMSAMSIIYANISTNVGASMFVSGTVISLTSVLSFGIGTAAAIMLGNTLGKGDRATAIEYNKKFLILNIISGILMGTIIYFLAPVIVNNLYKLDPEVKELAITAIRITGCLLPVKFYNTTMIIGTFRSGGDTVFSMILEVFGVWGIGVPLCFISGIVLKLPIFWVIILASSEEVAKLLLGLPRVISGKWAKTIV